jgi:crotonobetainyl-CoA:carnitine CoA-transferase CaiB-like acyl-CoA transferase
MTALEGVRVVDLGQFYFAPYCTMLMARLGAEVIKIEAPAGDPYRRLPTVGSDGASDGASVQFHLLNSGKRLMKLDLKSEDGRKVFLDLMRDTDILVQNLSPGAMDRFGLSFDVLHEINPRLIMASGTGYGSFGPNAGQPAMDLTVQARSAVMSTTGFDDGPPLRTGPSIVDFIGGSHLLSGVLAALYQREQTGAGQHVEVALQDAIIPSMSSNIAGYLHSGGDMPERTGNRNGGLAVAPYNAYETADGWITLLCPTDAHWERARSLMKSSVANEARFDTMAGRCRDMDDLDAAVGAWTVTWKKDDLAKVLEESRIPNAPVASLGELLRDPHVLERGVIRWVDDDKGRFITYGSPLFLSDSEMVEPTRIGPLGRDTDRILTEELGYPAEEVERLHSTGAI